DWKPRAVIQDRNVTVLSIRLDLSDSFHIHDAGPVDAEKVLRVQRGFQAGDCLLLQMFFALSGQRNVIVLGFGIVELSDWDDLHTRAIFHHETLSVASLLAGGGSKIGRVG